MGLLGDAYALGAEPPFDGPIQDWARDNITLGPSYTIQGSFHAEKSRHLIPVFDSLADDRIRVINVLKAIQSGGSLVADVFVPWSVVNSPGPVMWNFHKDKMAKDHAETRGIPTMLSAKSLQGLLPEDRHKIRAREIFFRHGVPVYIQGPSEANLQSKSIRYLVNDECWQWEAGRLREARARTRAYRDAGISKELNISQGGEVHRDTNGEIIGDDWAVIAHNADLFSWEVQCLLCPGRFLPRIEDFGADGKRVYRLKWDKGGENVRYECPACGGSLVWSDALRAHWNATGRFVRVNELTVHMRKLEPKEISSTPSEAVSYHWPALICSHWNGLVEDYRKSISAKRNGQLLPIKAFLQKEMAYFWDEHAESMTRILDIGTGSYKPEDEWPEEKVRFMTVDCQKDLLLFYVVIRAWSATGESRRLFRGSVGSWEEIRELQLRFNVKCRHVAVDAGYKGPQVYAQCARHMDDDGRSWFALFGRQQDGFLHHFKGRKPERRIYSGRQEADPMTGFKSIDKERFKEALPEAALPMLKRGSLKTWFYLWSVPSAGDILDNMIQGKAAPWRAPECEQSEAEENEYKRQLAAEVKQPVMDKHGYTKEQWVQLPGKQNHYLDCERMQVVCASLGGVLAS